MNRHNTTATPADIFARRVTARLAEGEDQLEHEISERLRAARERALAHRKVVAEPAIARHPARSCRIGQAQMVARGGIGCPCQRPDSWLDFV